MGRKKLVVAIGRSAFGETFPEQRINVKKAANAIADLTEANYSILITHSNGQQISMVHNAMTEFSRLNSKYTVAPMSLCSAMSQGYVGYDLQNAIRTELLNRGIFKPVSTIVTQVKVDPFDKAFSHPTKVIGRLMTKQEAEAEEKKGNYVVEENGGFRRIIASPKPMDIYEIDAISALIEANQIVIAGGGGGIPVLEQGTILKGASAVIEKDLTAARLAELINADTLLFLTGVEKAYLNFDTPSQTDINNITANELEALINAGKFPESGMLPKLEGSISFVKSGSGRSAIITSLDRALDGINLKTGTHITK